MEEKLGTKTSMKPNRRLPPHIVQVIFSKLPIPNLPTCRLISKTWNDLVLAYVSSCKSLPQAFLLSTSDELPESNSPVGHLLCNPKMHYIDIDSMNSIASFGFEGDWDSVLIDNSCNGLLLITLETLTYITYSGDEFFEVPRVEYTRTCLNGILNPMTNEFIEVPKSQFHTLSEDYILRSGFGFSPRTNQYKLFRIGLGYRDSGSRMEAFTFGRSGTNPNHNQWRHVHSLRLPFEVYSYGVYLDGVIYWVGKEYAKENEIEVYGLDVETEKIESIASLEVGPDLGMNGFIDIVNDNIYVTVFFKDTIDSLSHKMQVWTMRQRNSWTIVFSIDNVLDGWINLSFHLIKQPFEDGQILFLVCGELVCLDAAGRRIEIKPLDSNEKETRGFGRINSLNFDTLSNILAGNN